MRYVTLSLLLTACGGDPEILLTVDEPDAGVVAPPPGEYWDSTPQFPNWPTAEKPAPPYTRGRGLKLGHVHKKEHQ